MSRYSISLNDRITKQEEMEKEGRTPIERAMYFEGLEDAEKRLVPLLEEKDTRILSLRSSVAGLDELIDDMRLRIKSNEILLRECRELIEKIEKNSPNSCWGFYLQRQELLTKLKEI